MRALSFFDFSGVMLKPWREAGYECHIFDLQHAAPIYSKDIQDGIYRHHWDALNNNFETPQFEDVAFVSFFPPCTHLAVSGSRWMQGKGLRALSESIEMFAVATEIAEEIGAPYLIENPVSTISTYWREPDYTFDPCDFGDPYTKKTCLWTGNRFRMPPVIRDGDLFDAPTAVEPTEGSKMHLLPPGPERANLRSQTPEGFARAVFAANGDKAVAA